MNLLEDLVNQIHKWPISVALVVALALLCIVLRRSSLIKTKLIPFVVLPISTFIYILIGDSGSVGPEVPYPSVVLGLYGFLLGSIACLIHGLVLKKIIEKIPGLTNGDTTHIQKPKDPEIK